MAQQKLNKNEILLAEYNYIASTVFQANEDRARATSFYLVSTGSLVAAILGTQFAADTSAVLSLAFFLLFLVLTIMGALTIAQLARLRAAWHESVQAMNKIKEYYIKENPEIAPAFKWRAKSVPATNKPYSIANLMAFEVTLLGGLTFGASIYFLLGVLALSNQTNWIMTGLTCVFGFVALWAWYKYLLVDTQ